MNPPNIVAFVIRHLDRSASELPAAHAERLKAARNIALDHRKVRSSARLAGLPGAFHFDLLTQRALARTAVAMMIAAGLSFWHADRYITRTAELDTAILTDEMPIDVLTDKGFDQWLQSSGEH